jgi:hypothetical protein
MMGKLAAWRDNAANAQGMPAVISDGNKRF